MIREIKFEFVFQHPESKQVLISSGYTFEDIRKYYSTEEIQENTCHCNCQPIGETNVVECNCSDYYDDFVEIAQRQFTGLQDKSGIDIYEGDIINHLIYGFYDKGQNEPPTYDKNQVVTFYKGCFCLNDDPYWYGAMNHTFEVIGNIHQHPELLK